MNDSWQLAHDFLAGVADDEKDRLYNGLLTVLRIHEKNQNVKHYSLRKLRRASHRLYDDKKKSFSFSSQQHQLLIQQIQEQHWLKTCYTLEILLDDQPIDISFIEALENLLRKEAIQTELQTIMI